jgi:hypothetical protein
MSNKNANNIFWITDPTILYTNEKYINFIPTSNMTRVEQLNAITRFCIYLLLVAIIIGKSDIWMHAPIMIIIFITILYYIFESDKKTDSGQKKTTVENTVIFDDPKSRQSELETGYYDFGGILHIGGIHQDTHVLNKDTHALNKDFLYSSNDLHTNICRLPTSNNPMMNDCITDLQVENPPEACNVDDEEIHDKMTQCFNDKLFMDVSDVFERENSQRQFFTVPQMNPPDQTAFANWLYNTDNFCKTNPEFCPRYEDIRFTRGEPVHV